MCDAWRGGEGKANTFEVAHLTSPPASFPFRSFGGRREQQGSVSMPVTDTGSKKRTPVRPSVRPLISSLLSASATLPPLQPWRRERLDGGPDRKREFVRGRRERGQQTRFKSHGRSLHRRRRRRRRPTCVSTITQGGRRAGALSLSRRVCVGKCALAGGSA